MTNELVFAHIERSGPSVGVAVKAWHVLMPSAKCRYASGKHSKKSTQRGAPHKYLILLLKVALPHGPPQTSNINTLGIRLAALFTLKSA
jgi:hypothetical protein